MGHEAVFNCSVFGVLIDHQSLLSWHNQTGEMLSTDVGVTVQEMSGYLLQLRIVPCAENYFMNYSCYYNETNFAGVSLRRDGNWSVWSVWSACSLVSGDWCTQKGQRNCSEPPLNGGVDCVGLSEAIQNCTCPKIPVITLGPRSSIVQSGNNVDLHCHARGIPLPVISWTHDGVAISVSNPRISITSVADGETVKNETLSFGNVQASDKGQYVCTALNVAGNSSHVAQLTVHVPPVISGVIPSGKTVLERDGELHNFSVLLLNNATVNPNSFYVWKFDNQLLDTTDVTDNYLFNAIGNNISIPSKESLAGEYTCNVSNVVGEESISFTFRVNVPARILDLFNESEIRESSFFSVNCTAHGVPSPSVVWSKVSGNVQQQMMTATGVNANGGDSYATLTIANVADSDRGMYRCDATNDVKLSLSHANDTRKDNRSLNFVVLVPPRVKAVNSTLFGVSGKELVLRMTIAKAYPAVTEYDIVWTKERSHVTLNANSSTFNSSTGAAQFNISSVTEESRGIYVCTVTTPTGTASASVLVNVEGLPFWIETPRDTVGIKDTNVVLKCTASAFPDVTFVWHKDGNNLTIGPAQKFSFSQSSQGNLLIANITYSDGGNYTCIASNAYGPITATAVLSVREIPVVTLVPVSSVVQSGEEAVFHCHVRGFLLPVINWTHDGLTLSDSNSRISVTRVADGKTINGTLSITNVQTADQGQYVCTALNDVGNSSHAAQLTVHVAPRAEAVNSPLIGVSGKELILRMIIVAAYPAATDNDIVWTKRPSNVTLPDSSSTFDPSTGVAQFIISSVTEESRGIYMCTVTTSTGTSSASILVNYEAPPSLIEAPQDTIRNEDTDVVLNCTASAVPPPMFVWHKDGDDLAIEPAQKFSFSRHGQGDLHIANIIYSDRGNYTCIASNAHGRIFASAILNVWKPASVVSGVSDLAVILDQPASLNCTASGLFTPKITWTKNSNLTLPSRYIFTMSVSARNHLPVVVSSLSIPASKKEDSANFTCIATNENGTDNATMRLRIVPDSPSDVRMKNKTSTSILLIWNTPELERRNDTVVIGYHVEYSNGSDWKGSRLSYSTQCIYTGLEAHSPYQFRVMAENTEGRSRPSLPSPVIYTAEDAPSEPWNVSVQVLNISAFAVQWNEPRQPNGVIRGYQIVLTAVKLFEFMGKKSRVLLETTIKTDANTSSAIVGTLEPYSTYNVTVRSRTIMWGPPSDILSARTPPSAPPPDGFPEPQPVPTEALKSKPELATTSRSFTIQIFPGSSRYGPISHYQVIIVRLPVAAIEGEAGLLITQPNISMLTGMTPDKLYPQRSIKTYEKAKAEDIRTPLPYVAAEFSSALFPRDGFFVVGGGPNQPGDRPQYANGPVEANAFYTAFLRAFLDGSETSRRRRAILRKRNYDIYTSSSWVANIIATLPLSGEDKSVAAAAVGVSLGVLAIITAVAFVLWLRNEESKDRKRSESQQ